MVFGTIAVASIAPAFLFHYLSFLGKKKAVPPKGEENAAQQRMMGQQHPKQHHPKGRRTERSPPQKEEGETTTLLHLTINQCTLLLKNCKKRFKGPSELQHIDRVIAGRAEDREDLRSLAH